MASAVADKQPGDTVEVEYYRGDDKRTASVELGERPTRSAAATQPQQRRTSLVPAPVGGRPGAHAPAGAADCGTGRLALRGGDHASRSAAVTARRTPAGSPTWAPGRSGMIFWPDSPRACALEDAEAIGAELHRRLELAGVFVNATLDEVAATADRCRLTLLQLHGDEGPAYCREAARRTGAKVMKAARVRDAAQVHDLRRFQHRLPPARRLLAAQPRRHRRELRLGARPPPPAPAAVVLSGGLTPDNVGDGDRGRRVPSRVDIASGTEAAPGRKDPAKLTAFFRAVDGGRRAARGRPHERARDRAALRPLRRPLRARDADPGARRARAGVARRARATPPSPASSRGCCATTSAGRRRSTGRARLSEAVGGEVWLKREDLTHTGSHKINNALGQALLARADGQAARDRGDRRRPARRGGGHGVRAARARVRRVHGHRGHAPPAAERASGWGCSAPRCVGVEAGARTLKEAVSAAIRDWVANVESTHYIIGSAVGPAPVSGAGARPPAHDRRRGARAGARGGRAAARPRASRASAAARTRSARSPRSSTTPGSS